MLQTVGLLTFISLVATVCFFGYRYNTIKNNLLFFIFCFYLLLNEALLFITAQLDINNHVIANINNLAYSSLAVLILYRIWFSVKGKSKTLAISKWIILLLICICWIAENFLINTLSVYNSVLSSIISLVFVVVLIYLINVFLFIKNDSLFKDSDGLLIIGMLIRSFFGGLLLLFLNYRMSYSADFYSNILILVNLALIVSNIFFLFAIICLPKNRKYTWPF
jgi:hypothetical protein